VNIVLFALLGCAQDTPATDETTDSGATDSTAAWGDSYLGTWDDLPVADNDLQGLQRLLNDKWSYFLYEMDKYNLVRDSATNDAMVEKMQYVFADTFEFNAYLSDGDDFGTTQGSYSPLSWLEVQDVDSWNLVLGTLLVPSYQHLLTVDEPGERMILEGYHEHAFVSSDIRLLAGESRQLAFETIVFEKIDKVDNVWRVTDYEETVWSASEITPSG